MQETPLSVLCDIATEAHARIQHNFTDIDPIVGVSQNMRACGIPADVMTIDCLKSKKRIILILHDGQSGSLSYQLSCIDSDPLGEFTVVPFGEMTTDALYELIVAYFNA